MFTDRQTDILFDVYTVIHTTWFTIQCTWYGLFEYLNKQDRNKEIKEGKKTGKKARNTSHTQTNNNTIQMYFKEKFLNGDW